MNYLTFILTNKRFLGFGFLLTFFSSIGQTFFIALFNPFIQSDLALSNGTIGALYSIATLCSAALMMYLGPKIDNHGLQRYTFWVIAGLSLACFSMAISSSVLLLLLCYILLRLTGQGLMCHIASVSMARYFDDTRGTAISIAVLGYPVGQVVFPVIVALALSYLPWHTFWWLLALGVVAVILPLLLWLLRDHHARHQQFLQQSSKQPEFSKPHNARFVLNDWRFYVIALGTLATGFINTGIFFQYHSILLSKDWSFELYSVSFIAYSLGNIIGSIIIGLLIDRFKAMNVLPFYLVPLVMSLILLKTGHWSGVLFLFMWGAGLSQGAALVIISAVWSELYGVQYLGAIRSWVSVLQVIATGISPFFFSQLIDHGYGVNLLLTICIGFSLLCMALLSTVWVRFKTQKISFS